ncbi:hypothetical protein CRUP_033574 [Coryphaenoides rupestris]|nr:hypothetical protein CRUP_033574 [Coryphaenoides rupestris]
MATLALLLVCDDGGLAARLLTRRWLRSYAEECYVTLCSSRGGAVLEEIEAKEACDWLRAAGFPQYAQLFEERSSRARPAARLRRSAGKTLSPVLYSSRPVKRDHDFLEKDLVEPLCSHFLLRAVMRAPGPQAALQDYFQACSGFLPAPLISHRPLITRSLPPGREGEAAGRRGGSTT